MNHSEYAPSSKVIFSDRGSIAFGMVVIASMVALVFSFCALKFKKRVVSHTKSTIRVHPSVLLKHRFLFKTSRLHSQLLIHPREFLAPSESESSSTRP